ncbi:MAG: trimeric intracellular cation channel family protein [Sphingomonadales bacterium]
MLIRNLIADLAPVLGWLDLLGIGVFAASGALAAARARQTLVTFAFFALVTGVGGGTVRDLLIGAPVFWVQDWRVPAVCLATALAIWLTPTRVWNARALDWFDAVGLAVYAVFGAAKSLGLGVPPLPAMMMGVITACVGGIIRDLLAGEPSILLRPEIYVTAAALAAGLFVALTMAGLPVLIASVIGAAGGFGLRALAISRGLSIPAYKD